MEFLAPFTRVVQPEELWQYKYPKSGDYVSARWLFGFIIPFPMAMLTLIYLVKRDKADFMAGNLAYSLAVGLNGFITDCMKITVGRPRPDYFWRCFPDGVVNDAMNCTNPNYREVIQGRKSFPSGHASFAFLSFGFIAFYFMGKLKIFNEDGRGSGTRLSFCLAPLMVAVLISISRTCDYHHHYTDVIAGAIIGIAIAYLCYRQYYPGFDSKLCNLPYPRRSNQETTPCFSHGEINSSENTKKSTPDKKSVKIQSGSDTETKALLE